MFRIWIYLSLKNFLFNIFLKKNKEMVSRSIEQILSKQSNKKFSSLFSQCRVGFLYVLKFLKSRSIKREIIFCAYNLPEMINISENLNLKIKFCDIDYKTGFIDLKQLKEKVSKNTLAIVLTNMFNSHQDSQKIKKIVTKFKITLIEDNAIYFDNFSQFRRNKIYSGNFGDYTIYSFNIMKNISSLYGGAVTTNNKNFSKYSNKEENKLDNFYIIPLIKQILIFFILKLMSVKILYNFFFIHIIRYVHKKNIELILQIFYPSLKTIKISFPKYYYTKISNLSLNLTYQQLQDKKRRKKIFNLRKIKNEYYFKKLSKINTDKFNLIRIVDQNYQNFIDFPVLVKDKNDLNDYLLEKGIEVRFKHYYNCQKLFGFGTDCINAEKYEKELICLPNHPKISLSYIDFIVKNIEVYYSNS